MEGWLRRSAHAFVALCEGGTCTVPWFYSQIFRSGRWAFGLSVSCPEFAPTGHAESYLCPL